MKDFIFNLNSRNILKEKFKINLKYKLNKKNNKIKLKNIIFNKEIKHLKMPIHTKTILKLKSFQNFNKEVNIMKIKNNPYLYYLIENKIDNEIIINNIIFIFSIIKIYINKYNSENKEKIENNLDNIFKILKFNEKLFNNISFIEELKELDNYKIIINDDLLKYIFKR
ncbi:hypothetical protein [Fusobacterium polymorphum]|uniref:Uncharacterized protein n=1 Tax=Fusobacterium nucleatum subsp. polymorphum TaxID=76857 RepID=A0A2C6BQQ9_FUSNP|nr:hypothetical protein [Fusobacterium polymorphum]PHI06563.1 hypothetical protein CBG54_05730 [Fusobacterium polymorphum]